MCPRRKTLELTSPTPSPGTHISMPFLLRPTSYNGFTDLNVYDFVSPVFHGQTRLSNSYNLKTPVCKTSTFQASYFNRIVKLWNYICKFSPPTSFSTTASFRNFVTEHMFHLLHNHFDISYPCTWSIVRSCPCHP